MMTIMPLVHTETVLSPIFGRLAMPKFTPVSASVSASHWPSMTIAYAPVSRATSVPGMPSRAVGVGMQCFTSAKSASCCSASTLAGRFIAKLPSASTNSPPLERMKEPQIGHQKPMFTP